MDLELKELGQTLVIGGFAFFGALQALRIAGLTNAEMLNFLRISHRKEGTAAKEAEGETWSKLKESVAFVAMAFALGVFLENISKEIAAGRDEFNRPPPTNSA